MRERFCILCGNSSKNSYGIVCISCGRWICDRCVAFNSRCLCQSGFKKVCLNCGFCAEYVAGVFVCCKETDVKNVAVMEVIPLSSGCEFWVDRKSL